MSALDRSVEHTLIHTGQNYDYELNEIFFDQLKLRHPDVLIKGACHHTGRANTAIETIGTIMDKLETYFHAYPPDAMLILGDTNSSLAAAYVAKRLKIPLFHMQAGNRSFDENLPEEINRRMIDHIADINMPYSDIARENLLREGLPSDRVIKTGSPMYEVLNHYSGNIDASKVRGDMGLPLGNYFVVSCHREASVDSPKNFKAFCDLLTTLSDEFHKRIIVSAHPRVRTKLMTFGSSATHVEIYKPFGLFDYMRLQKDAFITLSDSGTLTEDASILRFPSLSLRESTERPEGMEEGVVIMTGFNILRVMESIPVARAALAGRPVAAYNVTGVADKVVKIILSYVDYVNRRVWGKA
jgi:UDP-N-acetylglucosamine 2-epimerase (non-hydrolysing)